MSLEVVCKTEINNRDDLVEVLGELLGGTEVISIVEGGTNVAGYRSSRKPEILIKIPGLYGTAGYVKNKDGNYELVYDSSDVSRLKKLLPQKNKNKSVTDLVAQTYSKNLVLKKAVKALKGRVVKNEQLATGAVKLKVRISI